MKQFTIGNNDANQRLDRFVGKTVPLLPSSLAQKYIRLKRIKINSKGAKRDTKLVCGDTVQMYINDEFFEKPSEENAFLRIADPGLDIVYEDDDIILVNKEAGVLCHSDGGWSYATLIARIQAYLYGSGEWRPREENAFAPALCNRIDRNTSGIVIAAKNAEALRIINEKIKSREIDKYYLTVVRGKPSPPSGRLEGQIFKDASKNRVYVTKEQGKGTKTAITEYRIIDTRNGQSLIECRLLTGRTHQIRAQFASAGWPLLGDGKYGSERDRRAFGEKGQLLCSYRIVFSFTTDAGILNRLKGREFTVSDVGFVRKYFQGIELRDISR